MAISEVLLRGTWLLADRVWRTAPATTPQPASTSSGEHRP